MNRAEMLGRAKQAVCNDRNATHGEPERSFADIAELWSIYLGRNIGMHDVAAMMVLLKIARVSANPTHMDSWVDIAGYAACGAEVAGE